MTQQAAVVELFWIPGCSSCMRMKEFVTAQGISFESINVAEHPERAEKLRGLGLFTPAVCVGGRCVSGTGLDAVAALFGVSYDRIASLPPADLKTRYDAILDAACRYIVQLGDDGLATTLPDRDRPMLEVASQTVSVIRGFLAAYHDGFHDRQFAKLADNVRTVDDLIVRAAETRDLLHDWWDRDGFDDPLDRVIDTPWWGHRTLLEVMEREVWHSAQHTRQLMMAVQVLGIEVDGPLTAADLDGLPIPSGIHG
jgi:glutaredoxin